MDLHDDLPATKTCSKCGKLKPLSDGFYRHKDNRNKDSRDGFRSECKTCTLAKNAAWRAVHRPKRARRVLALGLLSGLVLPGEKVCSCCGLPKDLATGFFRDKNRADGQHSRCKDCQCEMFAAWTAANREKVLAHYGQWCACCKSTERLQIDHIAGNGREHRKELGKPGGTSFYQWLIKNDYPEGFQTLCLRCNLSKGTGERCRLNHSGKPLEMHGLAWRRVREGADAAKRDQVKDREVRYALPGQGPAGAE